MEEKQKYRQKIGQILSKIRVGLSEWSPHVSEGRLGFCPQTKQIHLSLRSLNNTSLVIVFELCFLELRFNWIMLLLIINNYIHWMSIDINWTKGNDSQRYPSQPIQSSRRYWSSIPITFNWKRVKELNLKRINSMNWMINERRERHEWLAGQRLTLQRWKLSNQLFRTEFMRIIDWIKTFRLVLNSYEKFCRIVIKQ